MRKLEDGQVTVFLSLLLMSFFLILSVCLEGIYLRVESANFLEEQNALGESALANYHKELLQQFHVFAIDGRYVSKMPTNLKQRWTHNTGNGNANISIEKQVMLTEETGDCLRHQIREYMKYREMASALEKVKQAFKGVSSDEDLRQMEGKFSKASQEAKDAQGEYEKKQVEEVKKNKQEQGSKKEEQKVSPQAKEDPRKGLKELLSKDLLDLVMPDGSKISNSEVPIVYGKLQKMKTPKVDFFQPDSIKPLFEESKKSNALSSLNKEGMSALYAKEVFSCATKAKEKKGICYEFEYLISGQSNDRKNLKQVVQTLLGIRFALNYSYLLSSAKRQEEAYTLAVGVAGIASSIPGIVEGIKILLLAAWAYGESIIDLRSLLSGNRVALRKTEDTWQLRLSNLGSLRASKKPAKEGIYYEDYLTLLLLFQGTSNKKYRRMMDLMEARMKESQKDFKLSSCVFSYELGIRQKIPALFYGNGYEMEQKRIYVY